MSFLFNNMARQEEITSPRDERILELFKENKLEGFNLIYSKYGDPLFSVCSRYSNDREEAEDFFHDAMLKIFDKIGGFKPNSEGGLFWWMKRLTVNMILDKRKYQRRHKNISIDEVEGELEEPTAERIPDVPIAAIREMVASLPTYKKLVFNMFYIDDYSHKEIGEMLGITENTSSSILSKARRDLGIMIKDYLKKNT